MKPYFRQLTACPLVMGPRALFARVAENDNADLAAYRPEFHAALEISLRCERESGGFGICDIEICAIAYRFEVHPEELLEALWLAERERKRARRRRKRTQVVERRERAA